MLMHSHATPKKCAVKSAKCYSKYNVAMTFYTAPCSASKPFTGCQCTGRCARASLVNCPQNDGTNAPLPDKVLASGYNGGTCTSHTMAPLLLDSGRVCE